MILPKNEVDKQRSRVDYNRAIEISLSIIEHCKEEVPWPTEHDDEMSEILEQLWKREAEAN